MSDSKAGKPPSHIEVFYDVRDGSYWYQLNGRYLALKKSDLFLNITRTHGITHKSQYFEGLSQLDWIVVNAMNNRQIDYAGSLAGHRVGIFKDGSGREYLVTDEPRGVFDDIPKKFTDPEFFVSFVNELLPGEQSQFLLYWLAIALRSLRNADFRPGQVIVLAGPPQCGKSLLQAMITEILGGRQANPMRYMMEDTAFNKDLAGAEHWPIEEPRTSTDTRTRIQFGNTIKECFNNRDFSIHGKGKEAITLRIFRRGSISINDDPDLLMVLPPLNGSVDDKMMLFKCAYVSESIAFASTGGEQDQTKLWNAFVAEVPSIRAWLLTYCKRVPKRWRDNRFGIVAYHHPELKKELAAFTSEIRLLNILDEAFFDGDGPHEDKEGKAMALENELKKSPGGGEADKLLRYANQFASLLGKLNKIMPERVSKRIKDGFTTWVIHPPSQQQNQE
jgi:hypothetical protein